MNGRLYDPILGRMLSPDNNVQMPDFTQNYNRYSYVLNNPLRYSDPSGETFITGLIGAAVGGLLNLAIQAISGNVNSFSDGLKAFGMGAVGGFLAGMGMPGAAEVCAGPSFWGAAQAGAAAVGSSYLPSINIPIGNNFTLSLSPSIIFGSHGWGLGANVGATISTAYGSIGGSYGVTGYGRHPGTQSSFVEQRFGYGATLGGRDFNLSIGSTNFYGGGVPQRTGHLGVGGNGWGVTYENDLMWGLGNSDNGDRYRTAGIRLNINNFSAGVNFFTGDPGPSGNRPFKMIDGHDTYYGKDGTQPDRYRLGAAYVSYGNYRMGWNSERIRHIGQNIIAHDILTGGKSKWFRVLAKSHPASLFGGFITKNPYTTW